MTVCIRLKYLISSLCKTQIYLYQRRCYSPNFDDKLIRHFENTFNISKIHVQTFMLRWPALQSITEAKIDSAVETLNNFGITKENIMENPRLLNYHSYTLKTRLLVLRESGITNVNVFNLSRYVTLVTKKTIYDLKINSFLHKDTRIWKKYIECFNKLPHVQAELANDKEVNLDSKTLSEIRIKILRRFFKIEYNISDYTFNILLKRYPLIKHRSFKEICDTLDIVQNELNFSKDRIVSHFFVIAVNPENIKKIISEVKNIGNVDIKTFLYKYPLLIRINYDSILKMKEIFKDENISEESQIKCPEIFTLSTNTVISRIKEFKEDPALCGYFNNPRILQLIYYGRKISNRLMLLNIVKKRCISLHKLIAPEVEFKNFSSSLGDKTNGIDIMKFLDTYTLDLDKSLKLRDSLSRHPFWLNTSMKDFVKNFEYLQCRFSIEDILQNCQLLLYPIDNIKGRLNMINSDEVINSILFTRSKKISGGHYLQNYIQKLQLSDKQKLSLCLYLLEQDTHYTGNGIWADMKTKTNVITSVGQ